MAIKNELLGGVDNANGDIIDADDVNDTNNEIITTGSFGNVPIGSVQAWLKSYTNTPTLPDTWVECNGQTLSDADSVYDGQTIPDLNGDNRFLRGNSTSGGTGGAEEHNHTVYLPVGNTADPVGSTQSVDTGTYTTSTVSNLPPYYNIVWIMRIK